MGGMYPGSPCFHTRPKTCIRCDASHIDGRITNCHICGLPQRVPESRNVFFPLPSHLFASICQTNQPTTQPAPAVYPRACACTPVVPAPASRNCASTLVAPSCACTLVTRLHLRLRSSRTIACASPASVPDQWLVGWVAGWVFGWLGE